MQSNWILKVVLLHEHTLTDVYTRYRWCVAESHDSHTILSVSSRYEFFWERPATECLCKFCSSVGSDLGVGAIDHRPMGYTEAVCIHWADTLFRWKIKNSQQISHMTGSYCSVRSMLHNFQYLVTVFANNKNWMNFDVRFCSSCSGMIKVAF